MDSSQPLSDDQQIENLLAELATTRDRGDWEAAARLLAQLHGTYLGREDELRALGILGEHGTAFYQVLAARARENLERAGRREALVRFDRLMETTVHYRRALIAVCVVALAVILLVAVPAIVRTRHTASWERCAERVTGTSLPPSGLVTQVVLDGCGPKPALGPLPRKPSWTSAMALRRCAC